MKRSRRPGFLTGFCAPIIGLATIFILFLSAVDCFAAQSSSGLTPVRLQLKWKHQFQFAGYYAAVKKGFYREAGLDVTLIEAPETGEPALEVIKGEAEFGTTGPDILLQRAFGHPVVALAVFFQHSPMVLVARKDSGINSLHDLAGKKVMIEPAAAEIAAYFKAESLATASITILPHSHTHEDFVSGRVDAISAYSSDELFPIAQSGCEFITFNPRSAGVDFYGDLLFTTEQHIKNNPQQVAAFVEASKKGWRYALAHPEEIVDLILAEYSQRHSREHLLFEARETQRLVFAEIVEVGYMNPGRWRYIADTYANLNMIPRNFDLTGFVYDPEPEIDFKRLLNLAAVLLVVIIIVFNISLSHLVKKRTLQLSIAKEAAEAANKAKSQFLANMSHELRTPLNGVIGFTELLVNSPLEQTQRQYAQNANISAHALLGIINNILDFSKIEAGKIDLDTLKTDLIKLLEQSISIIRCQAEKKRLELLLNIPPETPRYIYIDPTRLGQIIINLLGNSAKFTEIGQIELRVEFKAGSDNRGQFKFFVRDTGVGILEQDRQNIFKEFTQADNSTTRRYGGTGLGLSISKTLVEKMGGSIDFVSEQGNGSTFFFTLDCRFEHGDPPRIEELQSISNLLLVDDNVDNLMILQRTLQSWNLESETVESGNEALALLDSGKNYDVIIIDYMMPEMDGIETIRQIRSRFEASTAKQPIILLYSSIDNANIQEDCQKLDVNLKLVKPVRAEALLGCLCQLKNQEKPRPKQILRPEKPASEVKNSPRIMVVEDVAMNRILVCELIRKLIPDAVVFEALNGKEAIETYINEKVDLIFMDIQMPVLDGYAASREIRRIESETGNRSPIIALTASAVKGEYEKCIQAGMDEFITKPVDPHNFNRIFQKYLKR